MSPIQTANTTPAAISLPSSSISLSYYGYHFQTAFKRRLKLI